MNKDTVKGTINDAAGRARRQIGEWTGDSSTQIEGAAQQVKGKAQKAWGNVKDAVKDLSDRAQDVPSDAPSDATKEFDKQSNDDHAATRP